MTLKGYLLKRGTTRDDLQQPETTYNEQETTWNDPQRVRQNLERPKSTYNGQENTQNDQQQIDFEIILQYGAIGSLL